MKIITGLGNPGADYKNTRHNAGFLAVDAISAKYGISLKKKVYGGVCGVGWVLGKEVALFQPHTYMNLSGEAVNAICSRCLEEKEDLLVISDDVALQLGTIRLREKGSSGGHNGLKSVIEYLGTDFTRLRIGVGSDRPVCDMKGYVLADFRKEEHKALKEVISRSVLCAEDWLVFGAKKAMAEHNSVSPGEKSLNGEL